MAIFTTSKIADLVIYVIDCTHLKKRQRSNRKENYCYSSIKMKVQVYKSAAYNRLFVTVYRADKRRYVTKYASFTRTWWYETFMKWCIIFHFLTGMLNYIFWEKAPYTVMSWYYTLLQKLSKCEVLLQFDNFTATQILRENKFCWIQTVQNC